MVWHLLAKRYQSATNNHTQISQ